MLKTAEQSLRQECDDYGIGQLLCCSVAADSFDRGRAGDSRMGHGRMRGQRQTIRKDKRDQEEKICRPCLPKMVYGAIQSLESPTGSRASSQ